MIFREAKTTDIPAIQIVRHMVKREHFVRSGIKLSSLREGFSADSLPRLFGEAISLAGSLT
jgi:hypothetical protein